MIFETDVLFPKYSILTCCQVCKKKRWLRETWDYNFWSQFTSACSVFEVQSNLRAIQSINTLSRLILCHFTYFYGNVLEHMLLWSSAYIHLAISSVFLRDLATVCITTPSIKALNLHFPIQNDVYSICIMIYVCSEFYHRLLHLVCMQMAWPLLSKQAPRPSNVAATSLQSNSGFWET